MAATAVFKKTPVWSAKKVRHINRLAALHRDLRQVVATGPVSR